MTEMVLLGVVIGAQGIRGEVKVKTFTADPAALGDYGPLVDAKTGRTVALKVRRVAKGDVVIAAIKGVVDRNAAEAMRGTELQVPRSALPQADEGEFYYADLVGLAAATPEGRQLGTVVAVHNFGAGDMLEVKTDAGHTAMVPFSDAAVPQVDLAARRLLVDPAFWLGDADGTPGPEEQPEGGGGHG